MDSRTLKLPRVKVWAEMVHLAKEEKISRSRLTYYKDAEVHRLKKLDFRPDLLLLHDWPTWTEHIARVYTRRPEAEIVEAIHPAFVYCGHHHTAADFQLGQTRVLALNIITTTELSYRHIINPGWAALFEWDGSALTFLQIWSSKSEFRKSQKPL